MTTTEAERGAQAMLDQIRAGKTIFTRAHDEWMVIGPAADITAGAIVTATKANGTTSTVRIIKVCTTATRQGTAYATATFHNVTIVPAEQAEVEAPVRDTYRTTEHAFFGTGRRHASQPGATQYDDGTGRYNVQIWDNS
jgi:hypothetical protein